MTTGLNINFFTLITNWNPNIYVGGDNVIFWGPLAWTVIFGLTFTLSSPWSLCLRAFVDLGQNSGLKPGATDKKRTDYL